MPYVPRMDQSGGDLLVKNKLEVHVHMHCCSVVSTSLPSDGNHLVDIAQPEGASRCEGGVQ